MTTAATPLTPPPTTPGRLTVICGCMFSGKTARLIARLEAARDAGRRVVACKHRLDTRYDPAHLATHDGRGFHAVAVPGAGAIPGMAKHAEVVGVDEAQFFGGALVPVCETLREAGVAIIVAGIDHDAWGRPFPPLPELCRLADELERLHAPCAICGRPAGYSQRIVPVEDEQMVGGPGKYEPRCAAHFTPLPPPAPPYG